MSEKAENKYRVMLKVDDEFYAVTLVGSENLRARAEDIFEKESSDSWRVCGQKDISDEEADILLLSSFDSVLPGVWVWKREL